MKVVSADEIIRRDNDQTEKEPVKSEFIGQGLLANKSDLNVDEINVISVQQRTKSKDEGVEVSYDKTEEELSGFIDQFIESDLNVEGNVNKQEQRRTDKEEETEEVESADEIMRKERDENEEEFTDQPLLAMEADLNVEHNESNLEQGGNEEEEGVEIIMRENDETRESSIKCEFIEQGLLAKEADLNVEKHENSQKQRRNSQEYEETEDKPFKTELIVQEPEEQANLCGMQDTAMVQVVLEESIIGYVNDQDNTELYVVEESNHVKTKDKNQEGNSQMMNEAHQVSTWEGNAPLNEGLKLVENATLLQEKEAIEVNNEETKKETVGKENDVYKNEFSAFEKFTGIDTVEKQKACDTEKKETLNKIEVIVEYVETESQQLERTQIVTAEGCSSTWFEDKDNSSAVTVKLQKLEQSKEQKAASEVALKVDRKHIDDAAYDHNGSQQPAALTKPEAEVVITQPEKMTGSQTETAETTSKCKEEVAAIDVIKSAERETSLHEQPIDTEVAIQEIMRPCLLVQQVPLLEESADNRINELSLVKSVSEIQSVPFKQLSEFAVESVDEMQTYSMQNLDKCSKEAKLSSPKQTAEWFETLSEATAMRKDEQKFEQATDKLIQEDATLGDQINQNECTVQDSATDTSSHRLQLDLSDSLYMPEMQSDSQKDTEEQERTDEEENGLSDEIKHNTSGLTKESDDSKWKSMREMETTERKENESELESQDETFENMNVEIPNVAWKCEKELTEMIDIETMVVSTHGEMESVKKMEQPFTEQEKDKCELDFPEFKESKVMNKEHEKVEHGKSVVDCKEDVEQGGRPGLKRPFEKIAEDNDMDKPCVLTGLSLPSQASSLDFTVQKSKIAVKNPLVRPPKDPRSLINMTSVEPLIPPRPLQPSFPKKSHIEGASVPSKGVIGFKLPGLGAGFPALRKTEAGKKVRDGEEAGSETSHVQKFNPDLQSADDTIKQEIKPPKPKWTPPRQPGMGSPLMMAELKSKLKKPE
ncbi:probable serine/threonine-protein kinase kinX isoform X1 [Silurus meridionalis]|nr:probable serine/threonine-protein kinase kinX isoform X1 [Silurus meridionalis]